MRARVTARLVVSKDRSRRPNCTPKFATEMIGTSSTNCATVPCVCPATIASSVPRGNSRASRKISLPSSHEARSCGFDVSLHQPPACAASTTISAPRARSARASSSTVGASGRVSRPTTCAASVCRKPLSVIMPTSPTRTPATVTIVAGTTFGQATGLPVAASTMFAARNGNRARAAAAFSAPCMSPDGWPRTWRGSHSAIGPRGSTGP